MYSKLKSDKCEGETSIGKGRWMYVGENVAILDNVTKKNKTKLIKQSEQDAKNRQNNYKRVNNK